MRRHWPLWQVRVKKGAIKPRNEPYDISGLTFHDGMVAVMVDMRKPDLPFTVPIGEVPLASKAVFSQLKHELCGETAWMRSPEDVKGVFSDSYTAGELEDYTKNMSISTFSLPWPPIAAHLGNLDMDMGAPLSSLVGAGWRLEGVHSQPGPAGARARIAGTCAVLCPARERDVPFASETMKGGLGSGHEGVPLSSLVTAGWRLEGVHSQPGPG